jgi:ParB family chromosome partitioning protein
MNRRLGRGLAALIPNLEMDEPSRSSMSGEERASKEALRMVRLDQIRPNPEQPRMTFAGAALEELAESIKVHGVITPLLVRREDRGDGFVLIAGERRLRASGLAGLEEVPCWVRENLSSKEQLELALVENIQREDLDPIETAESYFRLVDEHQMTQAEVARRVGKDRATVANAIRLLRLPEFGLEQLRAGRISAGHGKALLSIADDDQLKKVLKEVIQKDLSVRATERLVASLVQPDARKAKGPTPAMARLGERLSRELGAKVKVEARARGQRGRIVIDYGSRDELEALVERISGSPA